MMEEVKLLASDHTMLYVHCWRAEQPKATILLAHGMTEHSLRYERFGQFLSQNGISLYCHDPARAWEDRRYATGPSAQGRGVEHDD